MNQLIDDLTRRVSADRLRDLTLDMVRIPSPTGNSRQVTEFYADYAQSLGLSVEIVSDFPDSPSTIARYSNLPNAPTLTLDGHLDTIHAPHVAPYIKDGCIFGRGAGDMKSGVAAMLEATRIIIESGVQLKGNLILATHSLHEAPVGHMEGLRALIARGDVFVDAALIAESGYNSLSIRGKGQALFEITITREGDVLHENTARVQNVPNPLDYAVQVARALQERGQALAQFDDPLLGPESFFLGQIHGGDFYNRVPTRAFLNGTYRYWPDKTWQDVEQLFQEILATVDHDPRLHLDLRLLSNGLGYEVSPQAPIVHALQSGYAHVVGRELPLVGSLSVCDVNIIAREAGIPAVAHGTGSTTAHADLEWVRIENIVRTARVFIATILNYLGAEAR
jgi:acetylornithine deacetylase/succinyl-diaminopimelate desuccinylase-like protein